MKVNQSLELATILITYNRILKSSTIPNRFRRNSFEVFKAILRNISMKLSNVEFTLCYWIEDVNDICCFLLNDFEYGKEEASTNK